MDINGATPLPEPLPSLVGSVSGASGLSTLQREWAREFVLSAGNATKAAVLAGYAESSAHISGRKNCLNPAVMAYVKQLSTADAQQFLPIAVRTFVEVATDPEQDGKARVMAAEKLVLMAGAMPKGGGVQVNVGLQVNGGQVQALIGEVWNLRQQRLSGIGSAMPDNVEGEALPALIESGSANPAGHPGGVEIQGPCPGTSSLPPPSYAPHQSSTGPVDRLHEGAT